mmetsp:Transcript_41644/g.109936  ORF Transcript_41644/g.109936 Transcript_41644/m.109936 type:complete len:1230 (+) Transcript_41644:356-4045(+)
MPLHHPRPALHDLNRLRLDLLPARDQDQIQAGDALLDQGRDLLPVRLPLRHVVVAVRQGDQELQFGRALQQVLHALGDAVVEAGEALRLRQVGDQGLEPLLVLALLREREALAHRILEGVETKMVVILHVLVEDGHDALAAHLEARLGSRVLGQHGGRPVDEDDDGPGSATDQLPKLPTAKGMMHAAVDSHGRGLRGDLRWIQARDLTRKLVDLLGGHRGEVVAELDHDGGALRLCQQAMLRDLLAKLVQAEPPVVLVVDHVDPLAGLRDAPAEDRLHGVRRVQGLPEPGDVLGVVPAVQHGHPLAPPALPRRPAEVLDPVALLLRDLLDQQGEAARAVGVGVGDAVVRAAPSPRVRDGDAEALRDALVRRLRALEEVLLELLRVVLVEVPREGADHVLAIQALGGGDSLKLVREHGGLLPVRRDDEHRRLLAASQGLLAERGGLALLVLLDEHAAGRRAVGDRVAARGEEVGDLEELCPVDLPQEASLHVAAHRPRQPDDAAVLPEGARTAHDEEPLLVRDVAGVVVNEVLVLQGKGPCALVHPAALHPEVPLGVVVEGVVGVQRPLVRHAGRVLHAAKDPPLDGARGHGLQLVGRRLLLQRLGYTRGELGEGGVLVHKRDVRGLVDQQGVDLVKDEHAVAVHDIEVPTSLLGKLRIEGLDVLRLAVDDVSTLVDARDHTRVLQELRLLPRRADAEVGLERRTVLRLKLAEELLEVPEVPLHQVLVVDNDVHFPPQEDDAVERNGRDHRRLALTGAHLRDERPRLRQRREAPLNELQADEHADDLGVVREHEEVELRLHDLGPPVEDGAEVVDGVGPVHPGGLQLHAAAGARGPLREAELAEDLLDVLLVLQLAPGQLHHLLAGAVLRHGQLNVLADPRVRLQAEVPFVGEAKVLLVHEATEKEDGLQLRQRLLELVDLVAVDEGGCALQEELVVGRLFLVREAEAAAQVREVKLRRTCAHHDTSDDLLLQAVAHAALLLDVKLQEGCNRPRNDIGVRPLQVHPNDTSLSHRGEQRLGLPAAQTGSLSIWTVVSLLGRERCPDVGEHFTPACHFRLCVSVEGDHNIHEAAERGPVLRLLQGGFDHLDRLPEGHSVTGLDGIPKGIHRGQDPCGEGLGIASDPAGAGQLHLQFIGLLTLLQVGLPILLRSALGLLPLSLGLHGFLLHLFELIAGVATAHAALALRSAPAPPAPWREKGQGRGGEGEGAARGGKRSHPLPTSTSGRLLCP